MTTHKQHWKNLRKLHRLHKSLHPMQEEKPKYKQRFLKWWLMIRSGKLYFLSCLLLSSLAFAGGVLMN